MTISSSLPLPVASAAPAPIPAPAINRIGRFHILHELGSGAIGTVYLAHDPVIDRKVAIKSFNPRLTPIEKNRHRQQFINEARAAGRLSHPNIITIFDAANEDGSTYIAMEYLQGRELHKLLDSGTRFDSNDSASIVCKLADALEYAHQNGVIHRDIKPANIFLLTRNQPKLVDFGIARAPNRLSNQAEKSGQPYTLFHSNLLGTPTYMSPEQALGKPVDARTDIYSLGAVLYEMLTGRKPFTAPDTEQLLQLIAYQAPPAPFEVDPGVPAELSRIAMKALGKRPEKRYQDAREMASDLRHYLLQQKRSRRRSQRSPAEDEVASELENSPPHQTRLFWLGCSALAAALIVTVIALLR